MSDRSGRAGLRSRIPVVGRTITSRVEGHRSPRNPAFLGLALQKLGRVESSASLGVVFTTLFALGLLLIRLKADDVHIDPDCVLYGNIETSTVGSRGVPRATIVVGSLFLVNLGLLFAF